jgi:hypothetical protein
VTRHRMWLLIGGGMLTALLIVATTVAIDEHSKAKQFAAKAERFDRFCQQVRTGVDMDVRDFKSADRTLQQDAIFRFGEPVSFHSYQEIALCAGREPHWPGRSTCQILGDIRCLRRFAEDALASLPK